MLDQLCDLLLEKGFRVATAESCTGGLVAKWLTDRSGSSDWFERGFITYSNESKQEMLDVSAQTIATFGAVSEQTVREMARGALANSHADVSLSVSGIAGPTGARADKPVGTVWFAWADRVGKDQAVMMRFDGDRNSVRRQAAQFSIQGLLGMLQDE